MKKIMNACFELFCEDNEFFEFKKKANYCILLTDNPRFHDVTNQSLKSSPRPNLELTLDFGICFSC
ncbi:hypothetical protein BpHYR1_037256 [Brachionus plicatilis]|uniref:Uncharacterized protein n=1 Tax=Brachionus plicatilis TaxID=10195 RepID=A0A3M7SPM9_BRAPC|nr:hypothetical protein BpHYR1_037256 [Brachionus plicatilis]